MPARAKMISAAVVGKLTAGVVAIVLCLWRSEKLSSKTARSEAMARAAVQ